MTNSTAAVARLRKYIPQPARYAELHGNFTLTDRDLEILTTVHRYRFLEARHIRALTTGSDQGITRRLQGLFHNKYLGRFVPPQRMRIDLDPGPPVIAYGLDAAGFRALRETGLVAHDHGAMPWNKSHTRRGLWFLRHRLLQSDFRCVLELAVRGTIGIDLLGWMEGEAARLKVSVPQKTTRHVGLAPDARFTVRFADGDRSVFLESDRGTEEHSRLVRKYQAYWWYVQSEEHRRSGGGPPRTTVLFVTTGEQRMENMIQSLRAMPKPNRSSQGGKGLFWFGCHHWYSLDQPDRILNASWRTVNATAQRRLAG